MFKGIIVDESLAEKTTLKDIKIVKTWRSGDWTLHAVEIEHDQMPDLARQLADGPWYAHFWAPDGEMVILFKERTFRAQASDPATHQDAIAYGKSIGIPEQQLNFRTDWSD